MLTCTSQKSNVLLICYVGHLFKKRRHSILKQEVSFVVIRQLSLQLCPVCTKRCPITIKSYRKTTPMTSHSFNTISAARQTLFVTTSMIVVANRRRRRRRRLDRRSRDGRRHRHVTSSHRDDHRCYQYAHFTPNTTPPITHKKKLIKQNYL